ncbi:DUF447 domain-containing protein [Methanobrevibacter sp.]|uniref:DUF447 domain-containing protein n=1 Tax=Methanobrevibacter sp. TaxID=66852 RepID=UPI002600328C|nr:DUF447 domain-containing protein [Methanobrevibacter sp.]MBQ2831567.1 DUF447 family protein [Methanobrevibacter sp.]
MQIDLSLIGMEKGRQYETIITTQNSEGVKNAAPMGVLCSGEGIILNRIFKGSHTLDNILSEKEFVVNITHSPELFTSSLLESLDESLFNDDLSLKDCDAYFRCEAISFTEAIKKSDPIKSSGEALIIKSKVVELVINRETKAFNRGFGYVIESLTNFQRFDLVEGELKEFYIKRFKEAYRVVNKVGTKEDIKAMHKIKRELKAKGHDL